MSAFVVSRGTIRVLVEAGLRFCPASSPLRWRSPAEGSRVLHYEDADAVGLMLWRENVRSVETRYPDCAGKPNDRPGPIGDGPEWGYRHRPAMSLPLSLADASNALRCYEYQTCETNDHADTEAWDYCRALRRVILDEALCRLAEPVSCEWEAPDAWEPVR